ncbi:hypothetical protein [Campylobacter sp.]|uniref:hypothetical protein n=1 Tax=Campylobacter sp. TaxID=205 RepID=UPI0025B8DF59|nr:hypothetical protein [Campylobacter sp.]
MKEFKVSSPKGARAIHSPEISKLGKIIAFLGKALQENKIEQMINLATLLRFKKV